MQSRCRRWLSTVNDTRINFLSLCRTHVHPPPQGCIYRRCCDMMVDLDEHKSTTNHTPDRPRNATLHKKCVAPRPRHGASVLALFFDSPERAARPPSTAAGFGDKWDELNAFGFAALVALEWARLRASQA